jgi:hypothetical protein
MPYTLIYDGVMREFDPGRGIVRRPGPLAGERKPQPCTHHAKHGRRCGVPRSVLLHDGRRQAPA